MDENEWEFVMMYDDVCNANDIMSRVVRNERVV